MDSIEALIARLEAVDEKAQYDVIGDVLRFAREQDWTDQDTYNWAMQCRNLGAFLDAARVLVPKGFYWGVESAHQGLVSWVRPTAKIWRDPEFNDELMCFGETEALALCMVIADERQARQDAPRSLEDMAHEN